MAYCRAVLAAAAVVRPTDYQLNESMTSTVGVFTPQMPPFWHSKSGSFTSPSSSDMLVNTPIADCELIPLGEDGPTSTEKVMSPQHRLRLTYRINCLSLVGGCPRLSTCLSPHPPMLQFHNLALLFVAISKGVTAAVVSVDLPIINEQIAPDGFSRM
jgi:hypothetical protein